MASKAPYRSNARFIELGSPGAPFRSLVNVDHITNVRFGQKIDTVDATYDDEGKMTAPPQEVFRGWSIVLELAHGAGGQNIFIPNEDGAVALYNQILDMIVGTGAPVMRLPKLEVTPQPSPIVGANGQALDADNDAPGIDDIPPLTDEELEQLANPEIDVDAIADAVEDGLGADENK